ncbi:hypothetical protein IFM89_011803 [Coptis chinensis]|uniref:BAG family molecular chaperone regulator 4 n=1 Tax=Coptis chinensis TaxID=261450 RepID=A0A835H5N2_9MAGN|nr:hypothetical protein IFM89_011803 [Coptis chinensis]
MMKKHNFKRVVVSENKKNEEIGWELRPGGMLVQKRIDGVGASGPMIKIKVSHGSYQHEINVPAQSTFGDLKRLLAHETGLKPKEQRLLFRGKEKEDTDCLHMAGVLDMSKVVLLEDPASREKKLQERKNDSGVSKSCEAIAKVRVEVDKLTKKVSALESIMRNGTKIAEKEFNILTELFMMQLLKLDGIAAEGEAKDQRRIEVRVVSNVGVWGMNLEISKGNVDAGTIRKAMSILAFKVVATVSPYCRLVRRVQSFVETLDILKSRNSNPFSNGSNAVSVTTKWQKFESGVGSLSAPTTKSSTKITKDWELFD